MKAGEPCKIDKCPGIMTTYRTNFSQLTGYRTRKLECNACGNRPDGNKFIFRSDKMKRNGAYLNTCRSRRHNRIF